MISSSRRFTVPEATKPQAATPNFVLSLLAACSSSVPAAGKEGEATFSEQLSSLLEGKTMGVGELNLIYSYRFGFSVVDALKFIGFDGQLEDFVVKQKRFSIHDGCISLLPVEEAIHEELPAADEPVALEDCPKGEVCSQTTTTTTDHYDIIVETESKLLGVDNPLGVDLDDIDIPGWHGVGSRLAAVLGSPEQRCCETASIAPTESTVDDDSDAESDVDVPAWHSVGSRLITACKLCHDSDDECCEDPSPDVSEWRAVGIRVIQSLEDPDDL